MKYIDEYLKLSRGNALIVKIPEVVREYVNQYDFTKHQRLALETMLRTINDKTEDRKEITDSIFRQYTERIQKENEAMVLVIAGTVGVGPYAWFTHRRMEPVIDSFTMTIGFLRR